MSYKLQKPYLEKEKADFIVKYNHKLGLRIEETISSLYALEAWEILQDDEVIDNTIIYEAEQAQKEAERMSKLKLTKREVFLGLYKSAGITPEQIRAQIINLGINNEGEEGLADLLKPEAREALIEFDYANEYYRGNPLIDIIGNSLGYSKEDLDFFFMNKVFPEKQEV